MGRRPGSCTFGWSRLLPVWLVLVPPRQRSSRVWGLRLLPLATVLALRLFDVFGGPIS
ncbi:hypothetical protein QOZ88_14895 [Blastococcus sp. BMG 814]|uniref:Uncharacterized protein n=1 Tax=Blastococcus carthaginiensis TaxID=3050034 RepID=A0ABT9IEA6_9ACTN|nr:hypothetical protein [Blastococcus carthaginiensis]MDP5183923.1 hypothetical protein [Blastococcus carthaginiensis]